MNIDIWAPFGVYAKTAFCWRRLYLDSMFGLFIKLILCFSSLNLCHLHLIYFRIFNVYLTHYSPLLLSIPPENIRGYRKATPGCHRLILIQIIFKILPGPLFICFWPYLAVFLIILEVKLGQPTFFCSILLFSMKIITLQHLYQNFA